MMKATDRILGEPRGDYAAVAGWCGAHGRAMDGFLFDYLAEAFRLAPLVGIDPAIVVAQSAHETGNWASRWWRERRNPAGIGITGDPRDDEASKTWANGTDAARAQIVHLAVYAMAVGHVESVLEPFLSLDPRYKAVPLEWRGAARTIADLTGKWATDPDYAEGIAARGNAIFPDLPDQEGDTVPGKTVFPFDVDLTKRNNGKLTDAAAWITIHNNGNPTSDRFAEREFVNNGGGSSGVMYHGAVDAGGVVQIMPLDRRGVHAGNADGNRTSVAFEMCVGSEPWATVKEHTAQLLAEIVTNSRGILDYGSFGPENFSLERVREHRQWPGANPSCPARLIQTDGGAAKIVARAKAIVAGTAQETPKPEPPPFAKMPYTDAGGATWVRLKAGMKRWKALRQTARRQWADPASPIVAAPVKKGQAVTAEALVITPDAGAWLVSKAGVRMELDAFVPDGP